MAARGEVLPAARAMPGSGLGLAIVADTAHRHAGEVSAHGRAGGGAVIELVLPGRVPDVREAVSSQP